MHEDGNYLVFQEAVWFDLYTLVSKVYQRTEKQLTSMMPLQTGRVQKW